MKTKAMKIKVILTSLLVFFTLVVYAQQPQRGGGDQSPELRAENMIKRLEGQISFSVEERDSMLGLFTGFYTEFKILRQQQKMNQAQQLKATRDEKVKALLGEERYVVYENFMKENEPQRGTQKKTQQKPPKAPAEE